ncbi:MAG: hypothetical protein M3Z66_05495 [Chloroflexota bacterium]|nr:hypothetical protein [Chloroflexota bacterium]
MWIVRVKDRGRDLVVHVVDRVDEAAEIRRVYELLGYAPEKIISEWRALEQQAA